MEGLYPLFLAFIFIFISELGDKTQLLVLSFSIKQKTMTIILGVILGSFLSHGLAILLGSSLNMIDNVLIKEVFKLLSYVSFIVFGLIMLFKKEKEEKESEGKKNLLQKISNLKIGYVLVIAMSILIGELGDKTFLASIGMGIQYPDYKIFLVIGAILGMVISNLLIILLGRWLSKMVPDKTMEKVSAILFLILGIVGLITFLINNNIAI